MVGIIIDIIIVLLIAISTYLGYKKGLINLAIQLVAFIVAVIITLVLYKPIGNIIINSTDIDESLQQTIQSNAEKYLSKEKEENQKETNYEISIMQTAKDAVLPETSKTLAINLIYGATIIILYIISRICLLFIRFLADKLAELPIIKQFNELGGAIYGALRGLLIIAIMLFILNIIITINPDTTFNVIMDSTYIAKTMSMYNILNVFLK